MRRVKIIIHVSRYQFEKELGRAWRAEGEPGETFMKYRKRKLKELKR